MRGSINIPKSITVSYKYRTVEGTVKVHVVFQGDYEVDFTTKRFLIDGVHYPLEVWLKHIEPYSQWTKIKFNA